MHLRRSWIGDNVCGAVACPRWHDWSACDADGWQERSCVDPRLGLLSRSSPAGLAKTMATGKPKPLHHKLANSSRVAVLVWKEGGQ